MTIDGSPLRYVTNVQFGDRRVVAYFISTAHCWVIVSSKDIVGSGVIIYLRAVASYRRFDYLREVVPGRVVSSSRTLYSC